MASDLFGSAEISNSLGYEKRFAFNGFNVVLGHGNCAEPYYHCLKPNKHLLTVASTRSGKGASLIIPNLAVYRGSSIVIDPKGENAYMTAARRRSLGQKTFILDPWGEVNRRYGEKTGEIEEIASFNPLAELFLESEHFADDVAYIADSLIINQGKDPHWDDSARELVAGLIAYCVEEYKEAASLPLVRALITKPLEEIAAVAKAAQEFGPNSLAARKLSRFTSLDSKENEGIRSTAQTQTAFLDSNTLAENLNISTFSFSNLLACSGATIYLVLPVDKLYTYGRWLRLMVSIGIRTISRNTEKLPAPVLFMLDEFGTIGKLSAVSQAVGLMAGLQMCIWVFVQDFVQLRRDYPDEWETFIANAAAITSFNTMDQFTAEYLSQMLGQTTVERISVATAEKRNGGFFKSADPNYSAMADQNFARALKNPDEIRRLHKDYGFIISNENPIIFYKSYYFNDPDLFMTLRSDPYYPDPKALLLQQAQEKREAEAREMQNLKVIFSQLKKDIIDLCYPHDLPEKIAYVINDVEKDSFLTLKKLKDQIDFLRTQKKILFAKKTFFKAKDGATAAFDKAAPVAKEFAEKGAAFLSKKFFKKA